MSTQSLSTYADVIRAIASWPRERRLALLRHLVATIDDDHPDVKERRRREALDQLEGILASDAPPPTDEEVARWLQEERLKKYG